MDETTLSYMVICIDSHRHVYILREDVPKTESPQSTTHHLPLHPQHPLQHPPLSLKPLHPGLSCINPPQQPLDPPSKLPRLLRQRPQNPQLLLPFRNPLILPRGQHAQNQQLHAAPQRLVRRQLPEHSPVHRPSGADGLGAAVFRRDADELGLLEGLECGFAVCGEEVGEEDLCVPQGVGFGLRERPDEVPCLGGGPGLGGGFVVEKEELLDFGGGLCDYAIDGRWWSQPALWVL